MKTYLVDTRVTVRVEIPEDGTIFTRVSENHDDEGRPQPVGGGKGGWRDVYYRAMEDESDVIDMFVYNAIANGVSRATSLDGWADLDPDAVRMDVTDVQVDGFHVTES